jgi:hypothetical protein
MWNFRLTLAMVIVRERRRAGSLAGHPEGPGGELAHTTPGITRATGYAP